MADLTQKLSQATSNIKSIHRVKTKKNKPTTTVKVTSNTWPAPTTLKGETKYEVNPCKIPYLRCNFCQQHGHSTKECTNEIPRCSMCGFGHEDCPVQKYRLNHKCSNYLGNHTAAYPHCPAFLEHKKTIDARNTAIKKQWDLR